MISPKALKNKINYRNSERYANICKEYYAKKKNDSVYQKRRARNRAEYRIKAKEKIQQSRVIDKLKKYGISENDYMLLNKSQGGVCAICGTINPDGDRLSVDHCHETGKVRGLLCKRCNLAVGNICDNFYIGVKLCEYILERC